MIINRSFGNIQFVVNSSKKRIMVLGDVHAEWPSLNALIKKESPDLIIQLGDFGFFPRLNFFGCGDLSKINLMGADLIFCGGNHEDWETLIEIETSENLELVPNLFYAPRCSTLLLPDGREMIFLGGAVSIDRCFRKEGIDWFRQEIIPESVMYNLPDRKIDIIASHTTPMEFLPILNAIEIPDPSRNILSEVVKKYSPPFLYCGHWHVRNEYFHKPTKTSMVCLSDLNPRTIRSDSWCWLR
jgi:hypothetical protein